MNIESLKKIELDALTERQYIAVKAVIARKSLTEIAKEMNCSKQNVSELIKSAQERYIRIQGKQECASTKIQQCSTTIPHNAYEIYANYDLSVLTPREKEMMLLKISGLSYREIANKLGLISTSGVGVILRRAREKLTGTYNRDEINKKAQEWRKKNPEKVKEVNKKQYVKNREKRIKDMKQYNKKYYQEHREEILEKQKK